MLRHVNDPDLPMPTAPFSQMVLDENYAFLSGIVASDIPGGEEAIGDIAAETRVVMTSILKLLASADLDMADVVRSDVHLVDFDEIEAMNTVYATFFAKGRLPARTTTQSDKLAGGGRVEITCMARRRSA